MDDNFIWDAYLLRKDLVLTLRDKGKFLRTMHHESIVKLRLLGPVTVTAPAHYKAKKEFYKILSEQDWFMKDFSHYTFRQLLPFIYVKNRVDERFHQKLDWRKFTKTAKKHQEVFV